MFSSRNAHKPADRATIYKGTDTTGPKTDINIRQVTRAPYALGEVYVFLAKAKKQAVFVITVAPEASLSFRCNDQPSLYQVGPRRVELIFHCRQQSGLRSAYIPELDPNQVGKALVTGRLLSRSTRLPQVLDRPKEMLVVDQGRSGMPRWL